MQERIEIKLPHQITRRRFMLGLGSLVAATASTLGYARYAEPQLVQVAGNGYYVAPTIADDVAALGSRPGVNISPTSTASKR